MSVLWVWETSKKTEKESKRPMESVWFRFPFSKTRFKCPLMILDSLNKYGKENSYHIKFIYWQSAGHWIQTRSIWKSDRYFLKWSIKKNKITNGLLLWVWNESQCNSVTHKINWKKTNGRADPQTQLPSRKNSNNFYFLILSDSIWICTGTML